MTVEVGRQLRIDEDILGMTDEALLGLLWLGEHVIAFENEKLAEDVRPRVEMLAAELERRGLTRIKCGC